MQYKMLIIYRFEGSFAVCEKEDRNMVGISRYQLIGDPREGDVIVADGNKYYIDWEEMKKSLQIKSQ